MLICLFCLVGMSSRHETSQLKPNQHKNQPGMKSSHDHPESHHGYNSEIYQSHSSGYIPGDISM